MHTATSKTALRYKLTLILTASVWLQNYERGRWTDFYPLGCNITRGRHADAILWEWPFSHQLITLWRNKHHLLHLQLLHQSWNCRRLVSRATATCAAPWLPWANHSLTKNWKSWCWRALRARMPMMVGHVVRICMRIAIGRHSHRVTFITQIIIIITLFVIAFKNLYEESSKDFISILWLLQKSEHCQRVELWRMVGGAWFSPTTRHMLPIVPPSYPLSWNILEYLWISGNILEYLGLSWDILEYLGICYQ